MSNLQKALDLHEQGFHVIPLGAYQERPPEYFIDNRCKGDINVALEKWPKTPRIKWKKYQEEQPEIEEIEAWWTKNPDANIAIITGIDVYVVDADSAESVVWCERYLTKTPFRVSTSKGRHYYYGAKGIKNLRNSVDVSVKIDIRAVGGYVVAAGSKHSSGVDYALIMLDGFDYNDITDLPELTAHDVEIIKAHNNDAAIERTKVEGDTSRVFVSAGAMQGIVATAADPIGESTKEGSRNNECARYAGLCFEKGYTLDEAITQCLKWNMSNRPPMSDDEVLTTVQSVANTRFEKDGKSVPLERPKSSNVSKMVFTFGDMHETPREKPEDFWGRGVIFRGSRNILAGEPKIGKSRMALAIAVACATGSEFLDDTFTEPRPFMWLQAEIHEGYLADRVKSSTAGLSPKELELVKKNLILSGRLSLNIMKDNDYDQIDQAIEEYKPAIICLDPIVNFSDVEENSNSEVKELLGRVDALAEKHDCASLLVHHLKKPSKGQAVDFDSIRGASVFRGWYDTGVIMSGQESDPVIQWQVRNGVHKSAHGAFHNRSTGKYEFHLIDEPEQKEKKDDAGEKHSGAVHNILVKNGGNMSVRDLTAEASRTINIDPTLLREAIGRALQVYQWEQVEYDGVRHYKTK